MAQTTSNQSDPTAEALKQRRYIRDLGPHERFSGAFSLVNAQLGTTRNGKPYLRCLLGDKTGTLPARMWSIAEELFNQLPPDGFVWAEGETQPYQGELQLIVATIDPLEPTHDQLTDLLPCCERDPEEMFAELRVELGKVQHPAMRALVAAFIGDEALMAAFKRAPAAKVMHHAYLGGLLEHTLNLLKLAGAVLPLYPKVNADLVRVGLLLHDMGKTRELSYDKGFTYTDRGELVGHIVEGAIMVHDKAQQVMTAEGIRFPKHAVSALQHIILSHHGLPEYGAAKVPMTPEALMVSMLDDLDAKTTIASVAARPDREQTFDARGNFTEKQWALGVKLFRPDPLAEGNRE